MREAEVEFLIELQVKIEELRRALQEQDVSNPRVVASVEEKMAATRGLWTALRRSMLQPVAEHPQHA